MKSLWSISDVVLVTAVMDSNKVDHVAWGDPNHSEGNITPMAELCYDDLPRSVEGLLFE